MIIFIPLYKLSILKIQHFFFGLLCIAWISTGISFFTFDEAKYFDKSVKIIQDKTYAIQENIDVVLNNKDYINDIIEGDFEEKDLKYLNNLNVDLFIYKEDTLIFWSSNVPFVSYKKNEIEETLSTHELKNGIYLTKKSYFKNFTIIATHQVKSNYRFKNKLLTNTFNEFYKLKIDFEISIEENFEIKNQILNKDGNTLYFYSNKTSLTKTPWQLICGVVFILFFLLVVLALILRKLKHHKYLSAFSFLILGIVFSKLFFIFLPEYSNYSPLINPELYASSFFGDSFSKIFINSWWLFCISLVFYAWFNQLKIKNQIIEFLVWAIILVMLFIFYIEGLKSLVLDSTISFNINSITEFNNFSFLGMLVISLFTGAFFLTLISYQKLKLSFSLKILFTGFILLLCAFLMYIYDWVWLSFTLPISVFSYLLINELTNKMKFRHNNSLRYLFSIFFAALICSFIIHHFNAKKLEIKKIKLASVLINQKDIIAEFNFLSILPDLKNDPFIQKYFTSPLFSNKELFQRISKLYFGDYFNKYNLEIKSYNTEGIVMKSPTLSSIEMYPNLLSRLDTLVFYEKNDGSIEYQSIVNIINDEKLLGFLHFRFTPKKFTIENVYPELLIEEKNKPKLSFEDENLDYALYIQGFLSSQFGKYPYPFKLSFENNSESDYTIKKEKNYKHFIYADNEDRVVIISSKQKGTIYILSIFSYFMIFLFLMSLLIIPILELIEKNENGLILNKFFNTFRFKISISIVLIILISFTLIGFVTVSYFSNEYKDFYEDDLITKQNSIVSSLDNLINENQKVNFLDFLSNTIQLDIKNISDLNKIDINIYDKTGFLVASSQPSIFSSGLISYSMNPSAYLNLLNENVPRLVLEEKIGRLKYLSSYIPLRNEKKEIIGFLNLPYFDTETDLKREISELLVSLINLYVLLLVAAILVGLFITNSVTEPLSQIGEKLSSINILSKNEPIYWKNNDEIGVLVNQYNEMIKELQKGAEKLAKTEREGAWREMARQIAHEIKNPLTPMKLSIQHLQRALKEQPEKATEIAPRVTETLIEQIDNLSEIATAFSSFAKMPKADKEMIDIVAILNSVVDLFKNDQIEIKKEYKSEAIKVYADKNQMISVFNNLIKNAIQATEEKNDKLIAIEINKEINNVIISISDNGVGIPNEMKNKIFTPNFTTKSSGTGLGLAISKQIIENSNGEIWFNSSENNGTTFFIKLSLLEN